MASFDALMAESSATLPDVVSWRRHIHQNPELSFKEFETSKYITQTLEGFKCPALSIRHPAGTAVIADLKGGAGEGPTVALRADIDALPLNEETDVPFKSTKHGVMHACGHDAHTAMLLGAAKVLCGHHSDIKGTVRFVFQPAEELPPGGARPIVDAGELDNVSCITALHISSSIPVGCVTGMPGLSHAGVDNFIIYVRGRGGHASNPHLLVDPIPIAAEVVTALQTIVSRKIDPKLAPVVSIATMTTGPNESHNVIPDEVKLMGTIRTFDHGVRAQVPPEIERVCRGIGIAHDAQCEFVFLPAYGSVDNDAQLTADYMAMAARALGSADKVIPQRFPMGAGEDFSVYQEKTKVCFMNVGIRNEAKGLGCTSLHSTQLHIDEDGLAAGIRLHVGFIHDKLMQ